MLSDSQLIHCRFQLSINYQCIAVDVLSPVSCISQCANEKKKSPNSKIIEKNKQSTKRERETKKILIINFKEKTKEKKKEEQEEEERYLVSIICFFLFDCPSFPLSPIP